MIWIKEMINAAKTVPRRVSDFSACHRGKGDLRWGFHQQGAKYLIHLNLGYRIQANEALVLLL